MARDNREHHIRYIAPLIICVLFWVFFYLNLTYAKAGDKGQRQPVQKPTLVFQKNTSSLAEIAEGVKNIASRLNEKGVEPSFWVKYGTWFAGSAALLIAIYFNLFLPFWRRPNLEIKFEMNKREYFRNLLFNVILPMFKDPLVGDEVIKVRQPGFNSRVKVVNKGRGVARNVQARLEKVRFQNKTNEPVTEIYYHPSAVKWSGEKDYNKVDIAPYNSYFFLDMFYCINETFPEIVKSNLIADSTIGLLEPDDYSGDIYWNVWVDRSFERGIPDKFENEGHFELNYIVMADNCKPIRFTACISWEKKRWNKPIISIRKGSVNNE